jgi:hypothetical protein
MKRLADRQEAYQGADQQARQELGDIHKLIDVGEPATIEGLMKELDVRERLDGMIDKCLKRLLFVKGSQVYLASLPFSTSAAYRRAHANCVTGRCCSVLRALGHWRPGGADYPPDPVQKGRLY